MIAMNLFMERLTLVEIRFAKLEEASKIMEFIKNH